MNCKNCNQEILDTVKFCPHCGAEVEIPEEVISQEITEETSFYVNENGMRVIVFDEYEVAPGYMGIVEFEIPMEVVQDLVQEGFLSLAA